MTPKEKIIKELKNEQNNDDIEMAHSNADDLLCEFLISLGYQDVVYEYNKVSKWYA